MEDFDSYIEDIFLKNDPIAYVLPPKYYTDFYTELMTLCDIPQEYIIVNNVRAEHKRALYEFQHHHCTKWVMKVESTKNLGLYVMAKT